MCVNNLSRVALDGGAAEIRTRDLLIASPASYRSATEPHNEKYTMLKRLICIPYVKCFPAYFFSAFSE